MKTSVYIATSLDGFIARIDGRLDWLDEANATVTQGEDCGYKSFIESVDFLIMGRKTYEKVLSFGNWPYGTTPVIVLSKNPITFPEGISNTVTHSSETPHALYERLLKEGASHLYIDGGVTIQRFLRAGLISELTITVIPILIGEGTPLFGHLESDLNLNLIETNSYDFGFVQMKYSIENHAYQGASHNGDKRRV